MSTLPLDNPNPIAFPATFDATVLDGGGYTSGDGCWSAYVNANIVAVWGADDWLGRPAIVERHSAALRARFHRYKWTPAEPRTWADAGNLIHHALRLGLLREETGPGGERGWRILDRKPHWIVVGTGYHREAKQVRGLPPAEQAAVDKAAARLRKLHVTLDRKARFAADTEIWRLIRRIIHGDPGATVPEFWVALGFIPDWMAGHRFDASGRLIAEMHHTIEMDRVRLREWIESLSFYSTSAPFRYRKRLEAQVALPEHAEIPAEDAAALGDLTL